MIPHRAILRHEGNLIKMDFRRSLALSAQLSDTSQSVLIDSSNGDFVFPVLTVQYINSFDGSL